MANYQTLTEINDLLEKIEILKTEKENLRSFLKNLKLQSSQTLYQYKLDKQKQNRIKIKSIFLKQNLLSFKEKESELVDKLKTEYSEQIEQNFEFLIRNVCVKISKNLFENNLERCEEKIEIKVICSENWQEMVQNCGFKNIEIIKKSKKDSNKTTQKIENVDLVLRIILPTKIYILDKNFFISNLNDYLVAQNLSKITKIKINKESDLEFSPKQDKNMDRKLEEIHLEEIQDLDKKPINNLQKTKTQELELEEMNLLETSLNNV